MSSMKCTEANRYICISENMLPMENSGVVSKYRLLLNFRYLIVNCESRVILLEIAA